MRVLDFDYLHEHGDWDSDDDGHDWQLHFSVTFDDDTVDPFNDARYCVWETDGAGNGDLVAAYRDARMAFAALEVCITEDYHRRSALIRTYRAEVCR